MKPPVTYFGGKIGLAPKIVSLMPPHDVYIEPFFGSGAVFFEKRPAKHEIVNDLDGAVVAFFRTLRDQLDELERVCSLTPYAREEYHSADLDEEGLDDLELARRWWVRVNQSFGKTAGQSTGFSVTVGRTQSTAATTLSRIGRFGPCALRLALTTIEQCDAVDLIVRAAKTPETVVYLDPPYLGASRSHRTGGAADYRVDMADIVDHERLAEALHGTPAFVILSGYPTDEYDRLYGDWWHQDYEVTAHSSNAATGARSKRTERLWCNQDPVEGRLFA